VIDLIINFQCAGLAEVFVPDAEINHSALRKAIRKYALRPMRQRTAGGIALRHLLVSSLLAGSTFIFALQSGASEYQAGSPRTRALAYAGLLFLVLYATVILAELMFGSVRHANALANYAKLKERRSTNPARWWLFNLLRTVTTSTPTALDRVALIDKLVDGEITTVEPADRIAIENALSRSPAASLEGRLDLDSLRLTFGVASLRAALIHATMLLLSFGACLVFVSIRWPTT